MGAPTTTTPTQPELNFTGQPKELAVVALRPKRYGPALVLGSLLVAFLSIESFIPLRTAVQIGADEGFELAKATLCLNGHHLYTEVWNDQPPLHTFLVTQVLKHVSPSILGPRLLTIGFSLLLLSAVFLIAYRITGLLVGVLTTAMVIATPGFLELSSSCMLEIPALATAVTALCFLLVGRETNRFLREIVAGAIFGLAIQMKLVTVIYVSLMALIALRQEVIPIARTLRSMVILGVSIAVAYVGADLLIERGAFLLNFQQTWASHFAPAGSLEYGSASQHPFEWSLLLKNWDVTVPALVGLAVLLPHVRDLSFSFLPLAWLALTFLVFGIHKPWWPYYYLHTAIPLCWCASIAVAFLVRRFKERRVILATMVLFAICAGSWMGARIYFQVTNLRQSPKIYSSPVIAQMKRFAPFAEWLYADKIIYSYYSGIPLVPSLAVVPIKRMWSGELTTAKLVEELAKYKPGLILLLNDGREVPFKDLLQSDYQLVYMDKDNRLYANKAIAKKGRSRPNSE